MCVGERERPLWCPLEYEFLPDFYYTCGIIGHTDRSCEVKLAPGEAQQFSKKLRCIPNKRKGEDRGDRFGGGRFHAAWRSGSSGSRGSYGGYGSRSLSGRSGSDAPSWRKEDGRGGNNGEEGTKKGEEEVTSPLKGKDSETVDGKSKRVLFLEEGKADGEKQGGGLKEKNKVSTKEQQMRQPGGKEGDMNSAMQLDKKVEEEVKENIEVHKEKKGKGRSFRRLARGTTDQGGDGLGIEVGTK